MTMAKNQADNRPQRNSEAEIEAREQELKRAQQDAEQLVGDIQYLVRQPQFRRYMAHVMAKGQMFGSVMTGNSQTYYLSGKQDFCREIWEGLARVDLDQAHEILRTNVARNINV